MVEVCYRSGHSEVHGSDFPHQTLQFLPAHLALCVRDGKSLEEFEVFSLWEGHHTPLHVNQQPQILFFTGPVSLA